MDNLSRTASSSFDAFKSKKILQSGPTKPSPSDHPLDPTAHNPWSSKTPEKPINPPRRLRNRGAALSIKDIRQCAKKLQIQDPPARPDPVTSPKQPPLMRSHRSLRSNKLLEKYEILDKFFSSLDSSIRLLRIKGTMSTFTNISPKMECLTDRRFTYGHLAQLKYIFPEAIKVEKILVRDERTCCMKPDLHVTLDVNAIGDDVKVKANSGNLVLRKVFRARLVEFSKAHPEGGEVPEDTLPEPFNQSKQELLDTDMTRTSKVFLTNAVSVHSQQPATASHLSQSFTRKFSKKVSVPSVVPVQTPNTQVPETCFGQLLSGEEISESVSLCSTSTTKQKGRAPEEVPARPPTSRLPATPIKIFGLEKNESSSVESAGLQGAPSKSILTPAKSTSTPEKFTATPAKSISTPKTATPALQTPKRCYMSPDDDLKKSPNKLVRRPQRSRSLKFDTPVKNEQVQHINESGNLLMDNDIFDLLPESLLLSIREKEKKTFEDQDPAISQARRRQQIITGLPKLFDTLHFFFQSIKRSTITKDELMHKIMSSQLDIVDGRELEEQLRLLLELVPEWIYEKSACTGDRLLCINKISSPESLRARLAEAK